MNTCRACRRPMRTWALSPSRRTSTSVAASRGRMPRRRALTGSFARLILREQLRGIAERLELERVARGVVQEHRGLFAGLSFEPDAGLDHERDAFALQVL